MQLTAVVVAVVLSAVAASAGNPTMRTFEQIYKIDQLGNAVANQAAEMFGSGSGARRQGANVDQCPQVTCVANGAACPSFELPPYCENCTAALQATLFPALGLAFATGNISDGNATAACQSWTDFYACLDAAPTAGLCDASLGSCGGYEEFASLQFPTATPAEINPFFTDCAACAAISHPPLAYDACNLFSSYCDNNTLTCMPKYTSGACTDPLLEQCGDPTATLFESSDYFCNSTSGLCQVSDRSKAVGDNCGGNAVCVSEICTAGVCVGKAAGVACTSTAECAYDHFCSNSTGQCTAAIAAAGACASSFSTDDNDWSGVCVTGYECTRATGNCEPFAGVVAAGTTCYFNSECGVGKYCDGSYQCAAMPTTVITCDPTAATLPAACTARYQDAECGCDFTTGDNVCAGDSGVFPEGCEPYIQSTIDCITANQCKELGSDACRAVCGEEVACIGECIAPVYQALFGSCFDNNLIPTGCPSAPSPSPAGSTSDASAFAASAAASVAAAAMVAN